MITSYVIDVQHVAKEYKARREGPSRKSVLRHFKHWRRILDSNGLLIFPEGWDERSINPRNLGLDPDDSLAKELELFRIWLIANKPYILKATDYSSLKADCHIGEKSDFIGLDRHGCTTINIMDYLGSDLEEQRESKLIMQRYSSGREDKFIKAIHNITKYSKQIVFIDHIWGTKADRRVHRERFAEGFAKVIDTIIKGSCDPRSVQFKIYTESWKESDVSKERKSRNNLDDITYYNDLIVDIQRKSKNGETDLFLKEIQTIGPCILSIKDAIRFEIPTRAALLESLEMALLSIGCDNDVFRRCSVDFINDIHDRFMVTDYHGIAFGRGFDLYEKSESHADGVKYKLRNINLYFCGDRDRVMDQLTNH